MDGFTLVAVHIVDGDLADHIIVVVVVARILPWLVSVVRVLVYTTELVVVGLSVVAAANLFIVYTTAVPLSTLTDAARRSCPWTRGWSGSSSSNLRWKWIKLKGSHVVELSGVDLRLSLPFIFVRK